MKKLLCGLLCAALLLCALGTALASRGMRVTNCKEWVSLRQSPNESAKRLAKVPLGALVTDCEWAENGFIACAWEGKSGYILAKYLETDPLDVLPEKPTPEELLALGSPVLDAVAGDWRVIVVDEGMPDCEVMTAVVFDRQGRFVSRMASAAFEQTELSAMTAFLGGTAENPCLMWFAGETLSAYDIGPAIGDSMRWSVPVQGAGMAHAVDTDGTVYLIGYYAGRLIRISPEGRVVWETDAGTEEVWWPYRIAVKEDRVLVTYAAGSEDRETRVTFRKSDGAVEDLAPAIPVLAQWLEDAAGGNWQEVDVSAGEDEAAYVAFVPSEPVTFFQLFSLTLDEFRDDAVVYDYEVLCTLDSVTPDAPLAATVTFAGDTPSIAFLYTDAEDNVWCFGLDISGEDGSLTTFPLYINPDTDLFEFHYGD